MYNECWKELKDTMKGILLNQYLLRPKPTDHGNDDLEEHGDLL